MSDNINENFFDSIGQAQDQTHVQQSEQQTHQIESDQTQSGHEPMSEDADLFDIKQRVKGMDEEAARLIQLQSEMEQQMKSTASPTASMGGPFGGFMTPEEKLEADARSIYVGNVDYSATAQELEAHFHGCGSINRVTILCDKFSGHPKGFAYVEFGDKDSVQTAMALDESLFKGRQIKVVSKRTNKPGISTTDRVPRGRGGVMHPAGFGYMGRGRGGVATGFGAPRGAFNPYMRSYRGRIVKGGRGGFAPYYAPY